MSDTPILSAAQVDNIRAATADDPLNGTDGNVRILVGYVVNLVASHEALRAQVAAAEAEREKWYVTATAQMELAQAAEDQVAALTEERDALARIVWRLKQTDDAPTVAKVCPTCGSDDPMEPCGTWGSMHDEMAGPVFFGNNPPDPFHAVPEGDE